MSTGTTVRNAIIGAAVLGAAVTVLPALTGGTNKGNDDEVHVTIKVSTTGYPAGDKWPVVWWKANGIGAAEPTLSQNYTKRIGSFPKGTHVRAWVVPPGTASQATCKQGIALFFDGVRVDGPIEANGNAVFGPAFTAGTNQPVVEKVIV